MSENLIWPKGNWQMAVPVCLCARARVTVFVSVASRDESTNQHDHIERMRGCGLPGGC